MNLGVVNTTRPVEQQISYLLTSTELGKMVQPIYVGDGASRVPPKLRYDQTYQAGFQTSIYPANFQPCAQPPPQLNSASSYADLQYLFGVQDSTMMPVSRSGRNRKRSNTGGDHVKHRRTRSGCYTCRGRRVKVSLRQRFSSYMLNFPVR